MQFNTFIFLFFLLSVLFLYYAYPSWEGRKKILLIASYIFYSAWNPLFIFLILFSTLVDWLLAYRIFTATNQKRKNTYLILSLIVNLGALSYFKYCTFFFTAFADLLSLFEIIYIPPDWNIILPVGISFYTFQTLSYTIDVYRGKISPTRKFSDYALYVSFFPQLVAGPIVRASDFLPQCITPKIFEWEKFADGVLKFVSGLLLKLIFADTLLSPFSDILYENVSTTGTFETWIGVLAFSGQIYFDFSGYSLCAIGIAMMLGFHLPRNFQSPYGAIGFSDFWRRWHISLSQWLRDYLYISLGGNRQGPFTMYAALFFTMFLGGLWHGAGWGFLIWGSLHGAYLIFEKKIQYYSQRITLDNFYINITGAFITFLITTLTWVFFRANNFNDAKVVFQHLFQYYSSEVSVLNLGLGPLSVLVITISMFCLHFSNRKNSIDQFATALPWWIKGIYLGTSMLAIVLLTGESGNAFIYFQF